ncbi:60s ribosomal protein L7A [Cryptosporidium andersoni]|uniref:60s ribosomal protein L7A n=1 Tax=Cryptosporidium andersoni TaxID=117008 RepID=A0A1J4MXT6_9CRYT|nr:60s ribosomal protein L7A [Cryptosporidium andersoni]
MSDQENQIKSISVIADPILEGKLLGRCLKLLRKVHEYERESKEQSGIKNKRFIRRGVHEVTKSIRKGQIGIVFLACDIYPVDIAAHIPILCEEKDIYYGYLGSKRTLGAACKSKRPASVLMIAFNKGQSVKDKPFEELYHKVTSGIKKIHPYL